MGKIHLSALGILLPTVWLLVLALVWLLVGPLTCPMTAFVSLAFPGFLTRLETCMLGGEPMRILERSGKNPLARTW